MRYNRDEFQLSKSKIDMSNLKILRERKGISQIKLGYLAGVSTSSIESYEQGTRIPSLPVIYRLSEVLNCSIDFLVGRNNELNKYFSLSENDKQQILNHINKLNN